MQHGASGDVKQAKRNQSLFSLLGNERVKKHAQKAFKDLMRQMSMIDKANNF